MTYINRQQADELARHQRELEKSWLLPGLIAAAFLGMLLALIAKHFFGG